jgi:hypothetical protein
MPLYLSLKQGEFLQLSANSAVHTPLLTPNFTGFIKLLPHAIDMAFFRPHINEFKNLSYLPAITENIFLIIILVLSAICYRKRSTVPPVVLCLFAFSITVLLICGYTIPFTGAIVRYRSLALPLLITPLLCMADFSIIRKPRN